MSKPQPMILFMSYAGCEACRNFRGIDGKPSDDKPWNSSLIREYLCGSKGSSYGRKNLCSKIIEIHDFQSGANVNNIEEFNIYTLIPSNVNITSNFMDYILADQKELIGDSILRISIHRKLDNKIGIDVEIDGYQDDRRCNAIIQEVENYFIWDRIMLDLYHFREHFRNQSLISLNECSNEEVKEDPIYQLIMKNYTLYCKNPNEFDEILRSRYDYDWFINKTFPKRLREIESFYPSWILVLPSEWQKGMDGKTKVYGHIKNATVKLSGNRYVSSLSRQENLVDLIKQYHEGRLSLEYNDVVIEKNNSIQDRLKQIDDRMKLSSNKSFSEKNELERNLDEKKQNKKVTFSEN